MTSLSPKKARGHIVIVGVAVVLALLWLYPTVWTLTNSLKPSGQIYSSPWKLPLPPLWQNFSNAWRQGQLAAALENSAYVTGVTVVLVLLLAVPAAYALTWLRPPARAALFALMLAPLFIPAEVILIPIFILFRTLHLLNSLNGLVIYDSVTNLGMAVVLLSSFIRQVPVQLYEAARLDGAGKAKVLRSVVVPLARPGIVAVALIVAVLVWNDFFGALILIQDPTRFTVPLALSRFSTQYSTDQGLTFAALAIAIVPSLIVFVFMQRSFVKGLTAGAVRG